MGPRLFNAVVVVFWLSTMTWLVVVKVLPPLQIGEPPNYRSIYATAPHDYPESVCWDMLWNDRPMGWAKTAVWRSSSGVTEVTSLVHFDHVPIDELAPSWIRPVLRSAVEPIGTLAMDANSRLEIDPLGRLSGIYSKVRAEGYPAAEIVIRGKVEGTTLTGTVRSGLLNQPFERYLPPDALMGDELSPQGRMPGLRIGQEWTVPVYSPFRFSDNRNPIEILHAKVEDQEWVPQGEESILTLVVVYRTDSGSILGGAQTPRGKLWVADDGTVVKQTTRLFGSELAFIRPDEKRTNEILALAKPLSDKMELERRWRRHGRGPDSGVKKPAREGAGND
ncbi:MAG: hypothetical protein WD894_06640 [Pirellulales bacterium]